MELTEREKMEQFSLRHLIVFTSLIMAMMALVAPSVTLSELTDGNERTLGRIDEIIADKRIDACISTLLFSPLIWIWTWASDRVYAEMGFCIDGVFGNLLAFTFLYTWVCMGTLMVELIRKDMSVLFPWV